MPPTPRPSAPVGSPWGARLFLICLFGLLGIAFFVAASRTGTAARTDDGYSLRWFFVVMGGCFCLTAAIIAAASAVFTRRARYMAEHGRDGTALVLSVRDTGALVNDHPYLALELEVSVAGQPAYAVSLKHVAAFTDLARLQPGSLLPIKVDPKDPQRLTIV